MKDQTRFTGTLNHASRGAVHFDNVHNLLMDSVKVGWIYDIVLRPVEPELRKCVHCHCGVHVEQIESGKEQSWHAFCNSCGSSGPWAHSRIDAIVAFNKGRA